LLTSIAGTLLGMGVAVLGLVVAIGLAIRDGQDLGFRSDPAEVLAGMALTLAIGGSAGAVIVPLWMGLDRFRSVPARPFGKQPPGVWDEEIDGPPPAFEARQGGKDPGSPGPGR
jgi:hypothetical protein